MGHSREESQRRWPRRRAEALLDLLSAAHAAQIIPPGAATVLQLFLKSHFQKVEEKTSLFCRFPSSFCERLGEGCEGRREPWGMTCPSGVHLLGAREASADSGSSSHGSQTHEAGPPWAAPAKGLISSFHR